MLHMLFRRKSAVLLLMIISLACTMFLILYSNMLLDMQNQLSVMERELPVTARISNLAGSATSMLEIRSEKLDKLNAAGLSETSFASVDLLTRDGMESEINFSRQFDSWEGFTAMTATTTLQGILEDQQITFAPGFSLKSLESTEPYCLIDKNTAMEKGLSPGDPYPVTLCRIYQDTYTEAQRVGFIELTVIGVFDSATNPADGGTLKITTYISDTLARSIFQANNVPYYYHNASLRITKPMQLNEWKLLAKKTGFRPVDITANPMNYSGIGLTVYDEVFINAVQPIIQNIEVFQNLYIAIYIIVLFTGGILSYLLMNSQRREIALCRALGTPKSTVGIQLIAAHLIPCLAGITLGILMMIPAWTSAASWSLAGYILCFTIGCTISMMVINRNNVIRTLTQLQ